MIVYCYTVIPTKIIKENCDVIILQTFASSAVPAILIKVNVTLVYN